MELMAFVVKTPYLKSLFHFQNDYYNIARVLALYKSY